MEELVVDLKERSYPIIIKKGLIDEINLEISKIYKGKKIFILTDKNVDAHYGDKIKSNLVNEGYNVKLMVLEPGEETKSFNTLPLIYNELLDFKFTRSDLIITLGGGVIGDLGGFVASTFLRGVPFVQIPTSLLAQVDSSVGGKVAVDLERGKNLVGSFYHPKLVLIDPNVLETLSDRFFTDGMAEVIKYGCIKDKEFFYFLKSLKTKKEVMNNIEKIIHKCCFIKKCVVENDEKDTGERMLLNFGHTLGHAIETYYNFKKFTHGEAVAIGMYEISKISEEKGISEKGISQDIKEILIQYGLPYEVEIEDNSKILDTISLDKKNIDNVLKVVLLKRIGDSFLEKTDVKFFS
ncbi:3-dehydroquinate synthase [Clostridium saccharobutylicum]|uniref:3-dehydroquinate synthase n=1 Tax=Clostridium saccharobutylicum DSM 13864 TaxID=1345695 RepID=U5MLK5_CLOSA|nr:3-dehydroquinate synthase [Clostridium saccharobutylicum]AGX41694.1 3-dehydroquinate synthase AroB [Clostridium saccharobutylicum DSM 13864]AQR88976.1 3-dehydroquinate synthase [Clostridium saccharobutylicum]AQR98877.1 3-dehydroquinate synthase [Clostridium saccharobutylicum]AQS08596.1 3-dehydroquinate synthase [Clostridium saccharobutylicum]AQS12865.1 3-dehydroquinate synthase [Clostridium saccharobutylicum]